MVRALLWLGGFFIAFRFIAIGTVPFLIDEPIFQSWAEEMVRGEKFRLTAMGGSSLPVPYGAGAIWLYTIPHLFSSSPLAFVLFHTLVYSTGFLSLFFALRIAFGLRPALYATLLAATSPFLFYFSRHTWDTTFFMPISAAALWILARLGEGEKKVMPLMIALSFLLALAINIQLACGPLVLTVGCALLFLWWRERKKDKAFLYSLLFLGALVFLLVLPYLIAAIEVCLKNPPKVEHPVNQHWGSALHLWWNILYSMVWLSAWKGAHFFQPVTADLFASMGKVLAKIFDLDIAGWFLKLLIVPTLVAPWFLLAKKKKVIFLHFVGVLGFAMALLVFQYLNIPMQPHYFQSFWWLPFLGLAAFLHKNSRFEKTWAKALVGVGVATNFAFLLLSLSFLIKNGGTRGLHHGTGLTETRSAVRDLCKEAKAKALNNFTVDISGVFTPAPALQYFISNDPACSGIHANFIQSLTPKAEAAMVYAANSKTDARLFVEWRAR